MIKIIKGTILEDDEKDIISSYIAGDSLQKISRKYHVNQKRIRMILLANDVTIRKRGIQVNKNNYSTTKKYCFNERYFENIDTEDKAYWLGFMYADGSVCLRKDSNGNKKGAVVEIILKKDDEYQLYNFINAINGNIPVKDKKVKLNGKIFNAVRVSIGSVKMANDLINNGCIPNKSLILKYPNFLSDSLMPHFIRGYFDGDGCVHFYGEKQCKGFGLSILGTLDFLNGVGNFLKSKDINSISISTKNSICDLHVYGIDNLTRFFNLIYYNNSYFLERKYNIFVQALNYYNKDYYRSDISRLVNEMDWS